MQPLLFWDASALAKRYFVEIGSETVNALRESPYEFLIASTLMGYVETYSILIRRKNDGTLNETGFEQAINNLYWETIANANFAMVAVDESTTIAGVDLIRKHNINASDAIILSTLLRFAMLPGAPVCVMVAADRHLVRAADSEGLIVINPQLVLPADAMALCRSLR